MIVDDHRADLAGRGRIAKHAKRQSFKIDVPKQGDDRVNVGQVVSAIAVDVEKREVAAGGRRLPDVSIRGQGVGGCDESVLRNVARKNVDEELKIAAGLAVARGVSVEVVAPLAIERIAVQVRHGVDPVSVEIDLIIVRRQRLGKRPCRDVRECIVKEIVDRDCRRVRARNCQMGRPYVDVFAEFDDNLIQVVPGERIGLRRRPDRHAVTHVAETVTMQVADEC
jgi:hypothetical protein